MMDAKQKSKPAGVASKMAMEIAGDLRPHYSVAQRESLAAWIDAKLAPVRELTRLILALTGDQSPQNSVEAHNALLKVIELTSLCDSPDSAPATP